MLKTVCVKTVVSDSGKGAVGWFPVCQPVVADAKQAVVAESA
jgi:hypothetical protein